MLFEENSNMNTEENKSEEVLRFEAPKHESSIIKVLGVGGAGTNAVNYMFNQGIQGVDFIVCNTDLVSLEQSPVPNQIILGKDGLGAGNCPEVASALAQEQSEEIKGALSHNTKMLFITAGMGGGTGTGAAPVIAKLAKEIELDSDVNKVLVIGIVTLPFSFEGRKRLQQAYEGIEKLRKHVDSILIIHNDKLRELYGNMSSRKAFAMADNILLTAAKSIAEIITVKGHVIVDFRDVNTVMSNSGVALMGHGYGEGESRAMDAIQMATTSPLLNDNDIKGAKDVLLYIVSPDAEDLELSMDEQGEITDYIKEHTGEDTNIIWGTAYRDDLENDRLEITFIATGFKAREIVKPTSRGENANPIIVPITHPTIISKAVPEKNTPEELFQTEQPKPTVHILETKPAARQEPIPEQAPASITPNNEYTQTNLNDIHIIHRVVEPEMDQTNPVQKTEYKQELYPMPEQREIHDSSMDHHIEKAADRIRMIREMMASQQGLEELEKIPAYEQLGIHLHDAVHSSVSEASKVSISHLDDDQPIQLSDNSFLNNNPD